MFCFFVLLQCSNVVAHDILLFQRARELFLKAWDPQRQRLPDNRSLVCYFIVYGI